MPQRNSGSFFECSRLPFCYFEYLTLGLSVMINQPIPEMNSSWERTIFGRFSNKQLFISSWISNERNHPLNCKTAKNKLLLLIEKVEFECNFKSDGRQTLEIPSPKVQSYDRRWQQWKMFDVRELNPAKMLNCINKLFPARYGFHVSVWFFFSFFFLLMNIICEYTNMKLLYFIFVFWFTLSFKFVLHFEKCKNSNRIVFLLFLENSLALYIPWILCNGASAAAAVGKKYFFIFNRSYIKYHNYEKQTFYIIGELRTHTIRTQTYIHSYIHAHIDAELKECI